jgi:16S rRNA processing protein RimM
VTTREPASISTEPRAGFVAVGRVLGAWGVRGLLRLSSLTDFPDRFAPGSALWLRGERRLVEQSHWRRDSPIVKLTGIDDPEVAAAARGELVEIPESDLHTLPEDSYYEHQLIGLSVYSGDGAEIGTVTGLLPTGANDVLVVAGTAGEYLLPMIDDVVKKVDLEGRRLVVELLEGLSPVARSLPKRRPAKHGRRPVAPEAGI